MFDRIRAKYHLSRKTAGDIAFAAKLHPNPKEIFLFINDGRIVWKSRLYLLKIDEFDYDNVIRQHDLLKHKAQLAYDYTKRLRIVAIIALRRAGLVKDAAVYLVKNFTKSWDDFDPI